MKKQVNSLGNGSPYGMIAVFILSLMFGTLESQAINKPSATKVPVAEEVDSENKIENWMNSNNYWGGASETGEITEAETVNTVEQWMVSGSVWELNSFFAEMPVEAWMSSLSYWIEGDNSDNQNNSTQKTISHRLHVRNCNF